MEPKSAAPPPPPRRRLLHLTGMFRSLQLPECDAPTGANTHVAPSARAGEDDNGPSAAEPGGSSARSPRLDADGFEFADAAPAAADARNTEARAAAAERDGASGGPSVVSGWDSVGSDFIRSVIRARTTGAAAMSRARNGNSVGDGNGDGDKGAGDGGNSNGDGSGNVKAEADGDDPRAFPSQPMHSESSRRSRSRSRSRIGSRSRSRSSNSSSSNSNSDRSHSRSPSQSAGAPPSRLGGRNGDTAVAISALKFVRSAVKAVRSTIGNHQSETRRGAAEGAKSGSENESAADEDDDDSDGSGDGEKGEDEGEGKGESEESGGEEDDEVDAGAAEAEGESDEDADSDYCEDEAEAKGEADGSSDAVTSEDDTGNGESESIESAADSSLSTRVTEVPPKAADGGELQAAAADSGDESSDTMAPRAGADAQRKSDKSKQRTHGGQPVHAVAAALIVAVLLVLAGVTIHRARMRAGQAYGYQRWSGGPLFSAFPRSFSEAVLRWQDGVTTPLGLTMAYIPGCVVQMKRCHEGGAYGLAQKRAASGFLERQTLLGVVSNSTATATLETCADAARVWHRRCDNTANEHVHTRFVDRNGTQTLCVYPPRGVRFELPKYLDAAGVCETPSECQRIAECFERKGWGDERWTRERLSNAQLSACLPAFGQRLSWFTAGRAGAFQHPTEWRQRVDCERLPEYTLAREAQVARRIAHDSIVAASA